MNEISVVGATTGKRGSIANSDIVSDRHVTDEEHPQPDVVAEPVKMISAIVVDSDDVDGDGGSGIYCCL
jgi:hypothetical protein